MLTVSVYLWRAKTRQTVLQSQVGSQKFNTRTHRCQGDSFHDMSSNTQQFTRYESLARISKVILTPCCSPSTPSVSTLSVYVCNVFFLFHINHLFLPFFFLSPLFFFLPERTVPAKATAVVPGSDPQQAGRKWRTVALQSLEQPGRGEADFGLWWCVCGGGGSSGLDRVE